MIKLSTGADSTLGEYRKLCVVVFGEVSPQVVFIDEKIAASREGVAEEVIADESQMIYLLASLK